MDKAVDVIIWVLGVAVTFGLVCLSVLLFSIQFGFDWSFLLCVCVWVAIAWARWIVGGGNGER